MGVGGEVRTSISGRRRPPRRSGRLGRRGAVVLEFAIISIPFFIWFLFIFELSYDLFTQVALDNGLDKAVREIRTGNATYLQNGQDFINNYLCPALGGRLECDKLYVNVSAPTFTGTQDYYNVTSGAVPTSGNSLILTGFSGTASFCNAQPNQFLLVSVIYIGPSFIGTILPGMLSLYYNGSPVHPTLSTTGIVVEPYTTQPYQGTGTPAPSC